MILLSRSVLLPEGLDTFSILPIRLLFSFFEKKKSLLLPSYRLQYLILSIYRI